MKELFQEEISSKLKQSMEITLILTPRLRSRLIDYCTYENNIQIIAKCVCLTTRLTFACLILFPTKNLFPPNLKKEMFLSKKKSD